MNNIAILFINACCTGGDQMCFKFIFKIIKLPFVNDEFFFSQITNHSGLKKIFYGQYMLTLELFFQ